MDQLYELQTQFSTKLQPQQVKSSIILKKGTNQALNLVALEYGQNLILQTELKLKVGIVISNLSALIAEYHLTDYHPNSSHITISHPHHPTTARSQTNFDPTINVNYCSIKMRSSQHNLTRPKQTRND